MPLGAIDQHHLRASIGYVELGMLEEAKAELEAMGSSCRHLPEVLRIWVTIYQQLGKWESMEVVTRQLVESNPAEPAHFVDLAYATRRARSLTEAHAVLTLAATRHPNDATIHFNLACCEAQLGNLAKAESRLKRATALNRKFYRLALDDPDLEPFWKFFAG